jgi:hypothetical protein
MALPSLYAKDLSLSLFLPRSLFLVQCGGGVGGVGPDMETSVFARRKDSSHQGGLDVQKR